MELLNRKGKTSEGLVNIGLPAFMEMYKLATPAIMEQLTKQALRGCNVELWFKLVFRKELIKDSKLEDKYMTNIKKLALMIERKVPQKEKDKNFMRELEQIFTDCNT